jgi:hypothetical protein
MAPCAQLLPPLVVLVLLVLGTVVEGGSTAKSVLMFAVDDLRTQLSICEPSHTRHHTQHAAFLRCAAIRGVRSLQSLLDPWPRATDAS